MTEPTSSSSSYSFSPSSNRPNSSTASTSPRPGPSKRGNPGARHSQQTRFQPYRRTALRLRRGQFPRFLSLPSELRDHVYRHLLVLPNGTSIDVLATWTGSSNSISTPGHRPRHPPAPAVAVLRVSRQVHAEAARVLYGDNTFLFLETCDASLTDQHNLTLNPCWRWMTSAIGAANARTIRSLELRMRAERPDEYYHRFLADMSAHMPNLVRLGLLRESHRISVVPQQLDHQQQQQQHYQDHHQDNHLHQQNDQQHQHQHQHPHAGLVIAGGPGVAGVAGIAAAAAVGAAGGAGIINPRHLRLNANYVGHIPTFTFLQMLPELSTFANLQTLCVAGRRDMLQFYDHAARLLKRVRIVGIDTRDAVRIGPDDGGGGGGGGRIMLGQERVYEVKPWDGGTGGVAAPDADGGGLGGGGGGGEEDWPWEEYEMMGGGGRPGSSAAAAAAASAEVAAEDVRLMRVVSKEEAEQGDCPRPRVRGGVVVHPGWAEKARLAINWSGADGARGGS